MRQKENQEVTSSKERQRWSLLNARPLLLIGMMLLVLLLGEATSTPVNARSARTDWQIRFEKIRVKNADEDDVWSDGDEPYLIPIGFRSTYGRDNSTDVFWGRRLYEVHEGADDGDQAFIENRMGVLTFPNIHLTTLDEMRSGQMPEVLGAVVIAMESDATPFSGLSGAVDAGVRTLEQELKRLIEDKQLQPRDFSNATAALTHLKSEIAVTRDRVFDSITDKVLDEDIWFLLSSLADCDDPIGIHLFLFVAADVSIPPQTVTSTYPVDIPCKDNYSMSVSLTFGTLQETSYRIGQNPLVFRGAGSTFEVTASVDKLEYHGANIRPAHSNKCLDVHLPQWLQNGTRIQQWECYGSGQRNQAWTLIPTGDGYYQIVGTYDNQYKCLDVKGGSTSNGAVVHQWECRGFGKQNQLWQLRNMGNGYYQIISKQSGKCLDVAWENPTYAQSDGARIQQWDCYGASQSNQLWRLVNP